MHKKTQGNQTFMIQERANLLSRKQKTTEKKIPLKKQVTKSKPIRQQEDKSQFSLKSVWIENANSLMRCSKGNPFRELITGNMTIGRSTNHHKPLADFSILQNQPYTISRLHCMIINYNGLVMITDLNSRYGTYVNDRPFGQQLDCFDTIQLKVGKHIVSLGPPECGQQFHLTIIEQANRQNTDKNSPSSHS
jgi:hypothetical protein